MTRIGIVCGYDLNEDLADYVEGVAAELNAEHCDTVIFSGGQTSPETWHSEAWTIAEGIRARVPHLEVILEECAMTTLDNLLFAHAIARQHFASVEGYVVFCDAAHELKVRLLSRLILGRETIICALQRKVPVHIRLFEPLSLAFELLAAVSPNLRHMLRTLAVFMKGLSEEQRKTVLQAAASAASVPYRCARGEDVHDFASVSAGRR